MAPPAHLPHPSPTPATDAQSRAWGSFGPPCLPQQEVSLESRLTPARCSLLLLRPQAPRSLPLIPLKLTFSRLKASLDPPSPNERDFQNACLGRCVSLCVCVHVCVSLCICMHLCMSMCVSVWLCVYMYVCLCLYMCDCEYLCIVRLCVYVPVYLMYMSDCVSTCMCVYVCLCVCMCL